MMDDPREVLKAAGVECAEVEEYAAHPLWVRTPHGELTVDKEQADAAILALARLVAEQQAKLDDRAERVKQAIERSRVTAVSPQDVLDLIDRVALTQDDEKRDAYLVAKYKWQRDAVRDVAQSVYDSHFGQRDDYGDYFQAVDQERLESLGTLLADLDLRWEHREAPDA